MGLLVSYIIINALTYMLHLVIMISLDSLWVNLGMRLSNIYVYVYCLFLFFKTAASLFAVINSELIKRLALVIASCSQCSAVTTPKMNGN